MDWQILWLTHRVAALFPWWVKSSGVRHSKMMHQALYLFLYNSWNGLYIRNECGRIKTARVWHWSTALEHLKNELYVWRYLLTINKIKFEGSNWVTLPRRLSSSRLGQIHQWISSVMDPRLLPCQHTYPASPPVSDATFVPWFSWSTVLNSFPARWDESQRYTPTKKQHPRLSHFTLRVAALFSPQVKLSGVKQSKMTN